MIGPSRRRPSRWWRATDTLVLIEVPLPWPRDVGGLPAFAPDSGPAAGRPRWSRSDASRPVRAGDGEDHPGEWNPVRD